MATMSTAVPFVTADHPPGSEPIVDDTIDPSASVASRVIELSTLAFTVQVVALATGAALAIVVVVVEVVVVVGLVTFGGNVSAGFFDAASM